MASVNTHGGQMNKHNEGGQMNKHNEIHVDMSMYAIMALSM